MHFGTAKCSPNSTLHSEIKMFLGFRLLLRSCNWTALCIKEVLFLIHLRNDVRAISFPMQIGAFTDESQILVPHRKMKFNLSYVSLDA